MRFLTLLTIITFYSLAAHASTVSDNDIAQEVTLLFLAYKTVINDAQDHINQPGVADKGLDSTTVQQRAMANYQQLSGRKFVFSSDPRLADAQQQVITAARVIIDNIQPLINDPDIGFKGIITAIFTRKLATEFSRRASNIRFKFTAPDHLLRSERNRADSWESGIFSQQFQRSDWPLNQSISANTSDGFRWMYPLYHEPGCLECHGDPKGAMDKVGFIKEGAKVGDLAGAFSLIIQSGQ